MGLTKALGQVLAKMRSTRTASNDGRVFGDNALVGDWRVLGRIGKGGNGEVYRVKNVKSGEIGALKAPPADNPALRRRFELELEVLNQIMLRHTIASRHFPHLLDSGVDSKMNVPYLVVELLQDLKRPKNSSGVRRLILSVCEAIRELEDCGYLHRDIKVENLMQRKDDEIVVIDFGLACRIDDISNPVAERISMIQGRLGGVGTPGSSAPEQLSGSGGSIQSEIYALGALASDCFGKKRPAKWGPIIEKAIYPNAKYRFGNLEELESAVKKTAPRFGWISYAFFFLAAIVALYVYLLRPLIEDREIWRKNEEVADLAKAEEAVKWDRKMAKLGDAEAQNKLGVCYERGDGVIRDIGEAANWYGKAAEQGYAEAQYNLGWLYYLGEGVKTNLAEAVRWWCKAAEQDNAEAQCELGNLYFNGRGVEKDMIHAVTLYHKAAEQGHAEAQYNLGWINFFGEGVETNRVEAAQWWHKAAEQGHADAQYNLGYCYRKGNGVVASLAEALKWYEKAALQGHNNAKAELASILTEVGVGTVVAPEVLRRVGKLVKGENKRIEGAGKWGEEASSLAKGVGKFAKKGLVLKEMGGVVKGIGVILAALSALVGFLFGAKKK